MKKMLLSVLTVSLLALTACGGVATPTPSAAPTSPSVPATSPVQAPAAAPTLTLVVTDPAALAASGLSVTLEGKDLVFVSGFKPISVRLKLPDGTYSARTGGAAGQALTSTLKREAVAGLVIEVGQAFYAPVAAVVLK